jgi:hypothetical protein
MQHRTGIGGRATAQYLQGDWLEAPCRAMRPRDDRQAYCAKVFARQVPTG